MGISLEDLEAQIGTTIRTRRQKLDLTLQAVSEAAEISTGYLSLIERDKATPTLTTLARIARALGVGIDFFIARPQPVDCITRGASRVQFMFGAVPVRYERLGAVFPGSELSCFVVTIEPGYRSEEVTHAGEETFYVLSGRLEFTLEGECMTLEEGDSAHYDATRKHGWANPFEAPVRVLWTGTIDLFGDRVGTIV
ncbi:XRE family transcriptional regulator [Roseivivax sp. GX 12232]|uniref:helix-turn-helix domain-containing protein n=1 Tax=Roseivivax sp. GX 12232 TaxID=2900547 RepID=UPI001E44F343|nr:XRE family transcriptional regulator [Roseivivax sp. GX 12232]MCE0503976.1 XRE family transcriptional regulator [Roseivivax sp. GX 12232]